MLTLGKMRHLQRASSASGKFWVLAIDHRDNLRRELDHHAPQPLNDAEFLAFKQLIIAQLMAQSSAVLTDPLYGIGAAITQHTILGEVSILAPLEVTDYDLHPSQRSLTFIPHWGVKTALSAWGDGVKLLLPYHPNAADVNTKLAQVEVVIAECARYDIPFFLEPIAYSLDPTQTLPNAELRQIVVESARTFSSMGVDILKLQFPVEAAQSSNLVEWREACQTVTDACSIPWVLLSGGVDFNTFAVQTEIACRAGASGVIAGRAVWGEAVKLQGEARHQFIYNTAAHRMDVLVNLCERFAAPWHQKLPAPTLDLNWLETYPPM